MTVEQISYANLEGWAEDDHEAALAAFLISAEKLSASKLHQDVAHGRLLDSARTAAGSAREFFEAWFVPGRIIGPETSGFVTGYFEPELPARRTPSAAFPVPLHARPDDLVTIIAESDRGSVSPDCKTHLRQTDHGLVAMPTRREIDEGALSGTCRELFYVADEVDRFVIQVQGSAALQLSPTERSRVTYDGKNGHGYTSLGRLLIDRGEIAAADMSMTALICWLKSDLQRARRTIWANESYVFFRELPECDFASPIGVLGTPLTPGRSLAVDPAYSALGSPIFIDAPELTHVTGQSFQRLMIAQDVGSAIKGSARGDIFIGTGDTAGQIAGAIKHSAQFAVLHPRRDI